MRTRSAAHLPLPHAVPATARRTSRRELTRWQEGALLAVPALTFAVLATLAGAPWGTPSAESPRRAPVVAPVVAPALVRRAASPTTLRVCADPNNLPFSNRKGEGFENRLVELVAADMGRRVEYTWWAQRRGFVRNTLKAGLCDVVAGVPAGYDPVLTTHPYYRSSYVFVTRRGTPRIRSFDDAALQHARIGLQMVGDDAANTPPAHALARRGVVRNVIGYNVYGDYARPNPPARVIDAVSNGDVDVAVAWGPLAGYFAGRSRVALDVVPVSPQRDGPAAPFVFDISMGVRHDAAGLRDRLDSILTRRRPEIERLLDRYGVPQLQQGMGPV